jgi:hypothetical protein
MKTYLLPVILLSLALAGSPVNWARADALQKDTPGAQGTEGTNPTHQDSNVTGPNGQHASNTDPAHTPTPAHNTGESCSSSCNK